MALRLRLTAPAQRDRESTLRGSANRGTHPIRRCSLQLKGHPMKHTSYQGQHRPAPTREAAI